MLDHTLAGFCTRHNVYIGTFIHPNGTNRGTGAWKMHRRTDSMTPGGKQVLYEIYASANSHNFTPRSQAPRRKEKGRGRFFAICHHQR